ncbi:hypothetical protein O1611_g6890 [Lasiodiplodia mahajangana]|uniref:Uncharacterized protein n=1 Tax=Lasiodiplodia mahajangana TaxID=1108764 RepID=A0ACC2JHA5_9PEZI|nr:hypothetical protein O1611_g6890 [Lasiodiplodia mahajangana]
MNYIHDTSRVLPTRPSVDESHNKLCVKSFFLKDDEAQLKLSPHEDRRVFLECQSRNEHSEFDVVFVHALGRDRFDAWRCGDVFWPDYIANDLPGARVLLFNYDTRVWSEPSLSTIQNVANDLARVLGKARRGLSSKRRIIWVAQSLGGFVVKAVCILSTSGLEKQDISLEHALEKFTSGVVFIGTPHRPLFAGGWRPIWQRIYDVACEHFQTTFRVNNLNGVDIEEVMNFLNQFCPLADEHQMRIFSFYEQHETSGTALPIMITDPQNGLLHQREIRDTLPGNYLTMSQFQSRLDPGYTKLRHCLQAIYSWPVDLNILSTRSPVTLLPSSLEQSVIIAAKDVLASKFYDESGDRHNNLLMLPSTVWQFAPIFKLRRLKESLEILGSYASISPHINSQFAHDRIAWRLSTYEFKHWCDIDSVLVIRGSSKSALAYEIIQRLGIMEQGEGSTDGTRKCILSFVFGDTLGPENAIVQMLNQFLLQFLKIIPSLTRHFPTRRVFARDVSSWPEWDAENVVKDDQAVEGVQLDIDPDNPVPKSSRYLSYEDFVTRPFTILELVEVFTSILHDDQVGDVILVIDGLDDSSTGAQSQFQHFLLLVESLEIKKVKVCLCCDTIQMQSSKRTIYLDSPSNDWVILGKDEDPKYVFGVYYDAGEIKTPSGESLDTLISRVRAIHLPSHLALIISRQILKGLSSWEKTVTLLECLEIGQSENEKINSLYQWVIAHLIGLAAWKQIGYLFLVAATARSLTVSEVCNLAPAAEDLGFQYRERVMQNTVVNADRKTNIETVQEVHALETRLLGLLKIMNGTLVMFHPSLKRFLLRKLGEHNLQFCADYHLGISCLKSMRVLVETTEGTSYGWERREYSVAAEKLNYPLRYWSKHLRAAHSSKEWNLPQSVETLTLLTSLWQNSETRKIMRNFSKAILPPVTELPLSCLLASCDLSKVLDAYYSEAEWEKPPVDGYATLEERCATVNFGINTLKVLEKHNQANHLNDQHGKSLRSYESWARSRQFAEQFFLLGWMFEPMGADITEERHWGTIRQMLKEPSKLRRLQSEGYLDRLLLLAIRRCDKEFAIQLLDNGANRNYVDLDDPRKPSVLHIAAALGDYGLARELVDRMCRLSITDAFGMQPIHWAAERGHYEIVRLLISPSLDCDGRFGRNALFMLCESVSPRALQALLRFGPGIDLPDNRQRTPIHVAAAIGATEIIRLLLSNGANAEAQDDEGLTPLHLAAFGGWTGVVDELLSAGVSSNTVTKAQKTPLHFACESPNPSLAVALILLQQQSNPYSMDSKGLTPLHIAVRNGSVALIELLLKAIPYPHDLTELLSLAEGSNEIRRMLLKRQQYNTSLFLSRLEDRQLTDQISDASVNVVFVHGYFDSPELTWSDGSSKLTWPRKYLSTSKANARAFFWDHPLELTDFSSLNSIYELGTRLLDYVALTVYSNRSTSRWKEGRESEPLVFVSHSLGGLVVKAAITIAEAAKVHHPLLANIKGIAFLGTPHKPWDSGSLSEVVGKLAQVALNNRLEPGRGQLSYQRYAGRQRRRGDTGDYRKLELKFMKTCSAQHIEVLALAEQVKQLVPSDCASYAPSFASSSFVNKDHESLSRIDDTDDIVYKEILQFLLTIIAKNRPSEKGTETTSGQDYDVRLINCAMHDCAFQSVL